MTHSNLVKEVEGLMVGDISDELWREYNWVIDVDSDGNQTRTSYRIENPVALYWRSGGSTHRVVDKDGVAHCVPTVGEKGCVLTWKNEHEIPVRW